MKQDLYIFDGKSEKPVRSRRRSAIKKSKSRSKVSRKVVNARSEAREQIKTRQKSVSKRLIEKSSRKSASKKRSIRKSSKKSSKKSSRKSSSKRSSRKSSRKSSSKKSSRKSARKSSSKKSSRKSPRKSSSKKSSRKSARKSSSKKSSRKSARKSSSKKSSRKSARKSSSKRSSRKSARKSSSKRSSRKSPRKSSSKKSSRKSPRKSSSKKSSRKSPRKSSSKKSSRKSARKSSSKKSSRKSARKSSSKKSSRKSARKSTSKKSARKLSKKKSISLKIKRNNTAFLTCSKKGLRSKSCKKSMKNISKKAKKTISDLVSRLSDKKNANIKLLIREQIKLRQQAVIDKLMKNKIQEPSKVEDNLLSIKDKVEDKIGKPLNNDTILQILDEIPPETLDLAINASTPTEASNIIAPAILNIPTDVIQSILKDCECTDYLGYVKSINANSNIESLALLKEYNKKTRESLKGKCNFKNSKLLDCFNNAKYTIDDDAEDFVKSTSDIKIIIESYLRSRGTDGITESTSMQIFEKLSHDEKGDILLSDSYEEFKSLLDRALNNLEKSQPNIIEEIISQDNVTALDEEDIIFDAIKDKVETTVGKPLQDDTILQILEKIPPETLDLAINASTPTEALNIITPALLELPPVVIDYIIKDCECDDYLGYMRTINANSNIESLALLKEYTRITGESLRGKCNFIKKSFNDCLRKNNYKITPTKEELAEFEVNIYKIIEDKLDAGKLSTTTLDAIYDSLIDNNLINTILINEPYEEFKSILSTAIDKLDKGILNVILKENIISVAKNDIKEVETKLVEQLIKDEKIPKAEVEAADKLLDSDLARGLLIDKVNPVQIVTEDKIDSKVTMLQIVTALPDNVVTSINNAKTENDLAIIVVDALNDKPKLIEDIKNILEACTCEQFIEQLLLELPKGEIEGSKEINQSRFDEYVKQMDTEFLTVCTIPASGYSECLAKHKITIVPDKTVKVEEKFYYPTEEYTKGYITYFTKNNIDPEIVLKTYKFPKELTNDRDKLIYVMKENIALGKVSNMYKFFTTFKIDVESVTKKFEKNDKIYQKILSDNQKLEYIYEYMLKDLLSKLSEANAYFDSIEVEEQVALEKKFSNIPRYKWIQDNICTTEMQKQALITILLYELAKKSIIGKRIKDFEKTFQLTKLTVDKKKAFELANGYFEKITLASMSDRGLSSDVLDNELAETYNMLFKRFGNILNKYTDSTDKIIELYNIFQKQYINKRVTSSELDEANKYFTDIGRGFGLFTATPPEEVYEENLKNFENDPLIVALRLGSSVTEDDKKYAIYKLMTRKF